MPAKNISILLLAFITYHNALLAKDNSYIESSTQNTSPKLSNFVRPDSFKDEVFYKDPDGIYGSYNFFIKKNQQSVRLFGPTTMRFVNISEQAQVKGPLTASNSVIKNLELEGPLTAEGLELETAVIQGPTSINNSKIFNKLEVKGPLQLTNSVISNIEVHAKKIKLHDTIAHNITIIGDQNFPNQTLYLYLTGTSSISGTIEFIENPGKVIMTGLNAQINQIINGSKELSR